MESPTVTMGLAADPRALGDLQRRAKTDPEGALTEVARQFEALLLEQMLKTMRTAASGETWFDSESSRLFTELLDQEYAGRLAETGGLGLAELLVQQLSDLRGERDSTSAGTTAGTQ